MSCSKRPNRKRVLSFLVVIGIIGLCVASILVYARARRETRESICYAQLFQINSAIWRYLNMHGTYPAAWSGDITSNRGVSWRIVISQAWMGEDAHGLYKVEEPWSSANNRLLINHPAAKMYRCPGDVASVENGMTSYLAVVGPDSVWSEVCAGHIRNPSEESPGKVLVIEVPDSGVFWTEPRDLSVDDAIHLFKRLSSRHGNPSGDKLHYLSADGLVKDLNSIGSVEEFTALAKVSPRANVGPNRSRDQKGGPETEKRDRACTPPLGLPQRSAGLATTAHGFKTPSFSRSNWPADGVQRCCDTGN